MYVPSFGTTFSVVPSSNVAGTFVSIGNSGSPGVNVTVLCWGSPWRPVVVLSCPSGTTGVTVGVYVVSTFVPFLSAATTFAGSGVPVKSLFGWNVITPVVGSIVYVPTCLPSFVAGRVVTSAPVESTNLIVVLSIGAVVSPSLNIIVASCVWGRPCFPVVFLGSAVGSTASTSGTYSPLDVTSTLFLSESVAVTDTFTSTPLALPLKLGSGVNVTAPVAESIAYVPSPLTTTFPSSLAPSNEYLAVVQSTFVPSGVFAVVFNSENLSLPGIEVWTWPCFPVVSSSFDLTPYTVGV